MSHHTTRLRSHRFRSKRTTGVLLCITMTLSLLTAACSSDGYPTRAAAVSTGQTVISQLLVAVHFDNRPVLTLSEGPCDEFDDSHGDLVTMFGFPNDFTAHQDQQFATLVPTVWQRDGYDDVSVTKDALDSTITEVTAKDGAYSLTAYIGGKPGGASISVSSCYSTPGPQVETTSHTTLPIPTESSS